VRVYSVTISHMSFFRFIYLSNVTNSNWLVVITLFVAAAISIGPGYAFGLFIEPLEGTFGWSRTAISASLSFAAIGNLTAPIIGRLMDRHGSRLVITFSLIIMGISFLMRPLITELWHWYALSFVQYCAFSGATGLPTGRLVSLWFPETRGRIMGLTLMGNNFGGFVVPLLIGSLLASGQWEYAFLFLGGLTCIIALISLVVVCEPNDVSTNEKSKNETDQATNPYIGGVTLREALQDSTFYLLGISLMLGSFTYSSILSQVSDHLISKGMEQSIVPLAISLLAIFGMMGKLSFGYLSEKFTARRMMIISLLGQSIFICLMVIFPNPPIAWIVVPLFGLFMGSYGALFSLVIQEAFGLRHFGSIAGSMSMITVISALTGPFISGISFDVTGSYGTAFILVAILFTISAIFLTKIRLLPTSIK